MIALNTILFLMDFRKHANYLNKFSLLMSLTLCELKDEAVTVKTNVIYFGVDTILRPFHEAPI